MRFLNLALSSFLVGAILFFGVGNVDAALITDGLIAYYDFNGNTLDSSGNNYHGVKTDTVTYTYDAFGRANQAVGFADASAHISLGNHSAFNSMGNLFTTAFWINSSSQNTGIVIEHDVVGTYYNDWIINCDHGSMTFAYLEPGPSWQGHNSGISSIGDSWHHVAIQHDSSTGSNKFWIDGVLDLETFGGTNNLNASTGLNIGAYDVGGWVSGYSGMLDELYFYDRILTAEEIDTLYRDSAPVPEPATMLLMGTGLIGLIGLKRKRGVSAISRSAA